MDIYKILETLGRIEEAGTWSKQQVIDHFVKQGKSAASGAAAYERGWRGPETKAKPKELRQPPRSYHDDLDDKRYGEVDEGSMANAEHHSSGPKFPGYWKGTDKATPGNKMVGGCEESVEHDQEENEKNVRHERSRSSVADEIRKRFAQDKWEDDKEQSLEEELRTAWESFSKEQLDELGANNPAQGAGAAQAAQDTNQIKQGLQSLKQKVPGIDITKATSALTKVDTNQQTSPTDQAAVTNSLGGALADVAKNPQLASQLKNIMDKGQQMAIAQQQKQGNQ
jgi:hypothetical protein